jgi:hypothetical protein
MNRIYPYIGLLLFTALLSSCNISSNKHFHAKKYTKTRTHNKRLILANNKIKTNDRDTKIIPSKTSYNTATSKAVLNTTTNSEDPKQKIELSIFKKKTSTKPKNIKIRRTQKKQTYLGKPTIKATNKEKKYHKSISIANMILGTITVFFGIGIITFAFGYLSMNCYYQKDNLKLSKILYFSGLVIGILSVTILLLVMI